MAAPFPDPIIEKGSFENKANAEAMATENRFVRPPFVREYSRKKKLQEREQLIRER